MSITVIINDSQPCMNISEVGDIVFNGSQGFIHDLEEYSHKHKIETFSYNDEDWISCKQLVKITTWMQRTCPSLNTKDFLKLLRQNGSYKSTRRLNQTHRIHIMYSQKYLCASCREQLKPDCELDHIISLEEGGKDAVENLQALCVSCHSEKTYDLRIQKHPMFKKARMLATKKTSKYF